MSFSYGRIRNWSSGDTLTADDLNNEFNNILNNSTPAALGAQPVANNLTFIAALTLAANKHLLVNAAASDVELVTPYKIGTITRAMTSGAGDVATNDVGFKPSVVIFAAQLAAASYTIGMDDGTTHQLIQVSGTTPTYATSATCSIALEEDGGKYQTAVVKTLDAGGFTLTWSVQGTPASANGVIKYIALR